ncbi:hypothetical protein IQ266_19380, partial [filamentous cyanobacterium LEGE 11480]
MEIIKLQRQESIAAIAHKHHLGDLMVTYRPVSWIVFYVIASGLLAVWGYGAIRSGSGQSIMLGLGLWAGAMALIYRIYADS